MRINKEKLRDIMAQKNLTEEIICIRTGIYRKSLQWILDNGSASEEALERIADAVEIKPEEIYLSDYTQHIWKTQLNLPGTAAGQQ
ncbi:MAG: helix-turn-helix domain-containing protein [Oliverpabstia sp.]